MPAVQDPIDLRKDQCHLTWLLLLSHRQFPSYPRHQRKMQLLILQKEDDTETSMSSAKRQQATLNYTSQGTTVLVCFYEKTEFEVMGIP